MNEELFEMEEVSTQPEFSVNLQELVDKPSTHSWTDRGAVVTCEGAGHPPHRHYKVVPVQ